MILAWAVVLGIAASLVRYRGQTFSRIASIPLRHSLLVLAAVILQIPLLRSPTALPQELLVQQVLFILSNLLLLVFVWLNRHLPGVVIVGIGVCLNFLAIITNKGFMPISPDTLVRINPGSTLTQWIEGYHYGFSKDIILEKSNTNLWALSDLLILPTPYPRPTAFSLGDIVIIAGIVILLLDIRPKIRVSKTA